MLVAATRRPLPSPSTSSSAASARSRSPPAAGSASRPTSSAARPGGGRAAGREQPQPDHRRRRLTGAEPRPDRLRPRRAAALGDQHPARRRHRHRPGRGADLHLGRQRGQPQRLPAAPGRRARGASSFTPANPRPDPPRPAVGGDVAVGEHEPAQLLQHLHRAAPSGVGGPTTDCRGADSQPSSTARSPRPSRPCSRSNADVLGVNEIENDGYGPTSAIADLVDRLNAATAPGTYAFVDVDAETGQINALGTDAIKVGHALQAGQRSPRSATRRR